MFNDRYGLTQAVLEGRKTMTRRIIKGNFAEVVYLGYDGSWFGRNLDGERVTLPQPKFEIGEDVAIAQAYNSFRYPALPGIDWVAIINVVKNSKAWTNKLFVSADLMPYRIHITDVKAQWLHQISDVDCIKEGIIKGNLMNAWGMYYFDRLGNKKSHISYYTPRAAFASLIDRICGKLTWARNPLVYAYTFELIK